MADCELDVRALRKPDKHPAVFRAYDALSVGGTLELVSDHDPRHLRDEFEIEHSRSFAWDYLATGPGAWRIQITKLASTPLPRVLADTTAIAATAMDVLGAVWKLQARERDLRPGALIWLPRRSRRQFTAGPDGLRYLTVHQRRQALTLTAAPAGD
jgi:uncharacterized protein (DUF2249 family)